MVVSTRHPHKCMSRIGRMSSLFRMKDNSVYCFFRISTQLMIKPWPATSAMWRDHLSWWSRRSFHLQSGEWDASPNLDEPWPWMPTGIPHTQTSRGMIIEWTLETPHKRLRNCRAKEMQTLSKSHILANFAKLQARSWGHRLCWAAQWLQWRLNWWGTAQNGHPWLWRSLRPRRNNGPKWGAQPWHGLLYYKYKYKYIYI